MVHKKKIVTTFGHKKLAEKSFSNFIFDLHTFRNTIKVIRVIMFMRNRTSPTTEIFTINYGLIFNCVATKNKDAPTEKLRRVQRLLMRKSKTHPSLFMTRKGSRKHASSRFTAAVAS